MTPADTAVSGHEDLSVSGVRKNPEGSRLLALRSTGDGPIPTMNPRTQRIVVEILAWIVVALAIGVPIALAALLR
jgi:hypothetical protein